MFKKLLLVMSLLFTFSCEDNVAVDVDEETSMKLWLGGVEVDVEATYEKITTYGEEVEYLAENGHTYTKKIFVIHFQEEGGRVELDKEHYAIVFTDWEGRTSNSKPVDVGNYKWPAECPICVRICICDHGAPSKWVRMEIFGEEDVAVSGVARISRVDEKDGGWIISGNGEGIFYDPYTEANIEGKIEFNNLKMNTNSEESPYYNYGGR
jgi:hypothetical protein